MKNNLYIIKLIAIAVAIFTSAPELTYKNTYYYIILLLIYILNTQLRLIYLKDKLYTISIMADILFIYLLYMHFGRLNYIFLYITLVDGILNASKYMYGIGAVCAVALGLILKDGEKDNILLNSFVFLISAMLADKIRNFSSKVDELEYLYDEKRRYSYELEKAKKQLEMYTNKVRELTKLEERRRISEEIHDTVGHRLSALLIQLQAGITLLDKDEEKGRSFLTNSVDNLRESIEIMRSTVTSMRPKEYKTLMLSLQELIQRFSKETSVTVKFQVKGNSQKLHPGVETVLYKNTQEALTNSVRHGKATNIEVSLIYGKEEVSIRVKDNGESCGQVIKGIGLNTMEERLSFIRGSLKIEVRDGFMVESIVPLREN